jgi:hypothetical protein
MRTVDVPDPSSLSLEELRRLRGQLQHEDDAVSYARRVAQARLDLVMQVREHQAVAGSTGPETDWSDPDRLRDVLAQHLTGGDARPPRPTTDLSDEAPARELEEICASNGMARLGELTLDELDALADAIRDFETRASSDRRERFDRLDALTGELVRRYRASQAGAS